MSKWAVRPSPQSRRRLAVALTGIAAVTASTLVAGAPAATAGPGSAPAAGNRVDLWTGALTPGQLAQVRAAGTDHEDIATGATTGAGKQARVRVEVTLAASTAEALRTAGVPLTLKRTATGKTAGETPGHQAGRTVFRKYLGDGGIQAELRSLAAAYPGIAQEVTLGSTSKNTDITAVRVTRNPARTADGSRPAVVYMSAQHAREWITPEMTRRLLRHVLERYGKVKRITDLVNNTDLYFIPVTNPDGYDYTFTPGNRMWRKNLQDNDGSGSTDAADGVDPNRNFPTHWGYDNEGSSPDPTSMTYRGPQPASEAETRAVDGLLARVKPEFLINYHSAAELILYGAGFQVATPTPDDLVYEALVGDDRNPAVPGYDPDLSAELYTTNGETTEHAHQARGVLAFTPEMSTCETVSARYRDDAWEPEKCASVFHFPDDERLVHEEVQKNLPFALAVGESAARPDEPVSVTGRTVPDFQVDSFAVSYGDPQTVAVTARRSLTGLVAKYRIGRGAVRTAAVNEWVGGEVYGNENDIYFAEYRGLVSGAKPGDKVEVWFEAAKKGVPVSSTRFTYTLASDSGDKILIIGDEDYTGVNPSYRDLGLPEQPFRLATQQAAVQSAGYTSDVWDTDAQGVPHPLGVLSHYPGALWFTGLNRLTQDAEDEATETPFGPQPDVSVAERQQYLTIAVRDWMNEGGKLLHAGELAQYYGLFPFVGGLYYGANGDPTAECSTDTIDGLFEDCLILADDFSQYWLGANRRISLGGVEATKGAGALESTDVSPVRSVFGEAGAFEVTSDVLPAAQFPQFRSWSAGEYSTASGVSPFGPTEGLSYVGTLHGDDSWTRLTRQVTVPTGGAAQLRWQMSWNTEPGYDNVIVEARTAGEQDWTTLPDLEDHTVTTVPTECEAGFYIEEHPHLARYLTPGAPCQATGTTGSWNAFTGSSGGWQQVGVDLSGYAGKTVEVSISYVTDPGTGGVGAFVDDVRLAVFPGGVAKEGFEQSLGDWSVGGPPEGSPGNTTEWVLSQGLVDLSSGVQTKRSVLLGYGLDIVRPPLGASPAQLAAAADKRAAIVRAAFTGLGVLP